jgi:hypothetical protein
MAVIYFIQIQNAVLKMLADKQNLYKPAQMNKNHIDKHILSVVHNHIYYNLLNSLC